ncbi:MAG: SDH family Clp fold serine proteinase [Anaerolineales bacterium]
MDFTILLFLFFLLSSLQPVIRQRMLEASRTRMLRSLEAKRNSRVIALIHRQERLSFLGFPLARYIDINDSEEILRAIKLTDPDMPIDLILHTPGGLVLAAEQIAKALCRHPAKITVFVPHYAMSGGTLIALAADEIVMDENAVLGPVDPQIGQQPAASILTVLQQKSIDHINDDTLILADISRKAIRQVEDTLYEIIVTHAEPEKARALAEVLASGRWTHDYPISVEEARGLGLPISTDMPKEVYQLMNMYPQSGMGRPTVEYIPVPYPLHRPGTRENKS